jgi:hypothetical protein
MDGDRCTGDGDGEPDLITKNATEIAPITGYHGHCVLIRVARLTMQMQEAFLGGLI